MTGELVDQAGRKSARRRYVHLGAEARMPNGHREVLIVRVDREHGIIEWRRRRKAPRYSISLGRALELLMRRLDVETCERALGTAPRLTPGPRML